MTLRAHDPERTLERGYALAETADGRAGDDGRRRGRRRAGKTAVRATAESNAQIEGDVEREADSYEAAVERLEEIIDRLDSGQAGLRETLDLCREGRELVTYCAAELDAVGEGLKELNLDELGAAKLDESARPQLSGSQRPEHRPP